MFYEAYRDSLQCLQERALGPCFEPNKSIEHAPTILKIDFNIIISHVRYRSGIFQIFWKTDIAICDPSYAYYVSSNIILDYVI
jgi:hypothetical protein